LPSTSAASGAADAAEFFQPTRCAAVASPLRRDDVNIRRRCRCNVRRQSHGQVDRRAIRRSSTYYEPLLLLPTSAAQLPPMPSRPPVLPELFSRHGLCRSPRRTTRTVTGFCPPSSATPAAVVVYERPAVFRPPSKTRVCPVPSLRSNDAAVATAMSGTPSPSTLLLYRSADVNADPPSSCCTPCSWLTSSLRQPCCRRLLVE